MRIGLCQMLVGTSKADNLRKAVPFIKQAKAAGSALVVLPECFNSPYDVACFPEYAEDAQTGETVAALSKAAAENECWLIGGTFPERRGSKLFNTCPVFDPQGTLRALYRKVHLFDINIPGRIAFCESSVLSGGGEPVAVEVGGGFKVGLGVCYDLRFPELAAGYAQHRECNLLVYPGAFSTVTGPAYWRLLQQSRAVDNQLFVASCSPARSTVTTGYQAYGHSMAVAPNGQVLGEAGEGEEVVIVDLELPLLHDIRQSIPILNQKRPDVYAKFIK